MPFPRWSYLVVMAKGRTYTVTVWRFDPHSERYEQREVTLSVLQATRRYNRARKSGDQQETDMACSLLNQVREQAGLPFPVC